MDTDVTLTATLTKNDARDTRRFTLTVVPPCTTSEMTAKLKAMLPSLSGCSAASIRGADMPALRSAGVTSAQFLPVWSADRDMGFTPAQLRVVGVTVAEMRSHGLTIAQIHTGGVSIADLRSGGVADYLVFNEACNTPQTRGTAPNPTITLTPTTLNATDTMVILEGIATNSARWLSSAESGEHLQFIRLLNVPGDTGMLGNATGRYTKVEGTTVFSTLSIPLADVFSNPTVTLEDNLVNDVSIELCPGS